MRRFGLTLLALFGGFMALILVILISGVVWMRGSLPPLDGGGTVPGLSATATLQRDSLGIAVIRTRSFEDAVRAQGFAHGQDRFFQMDLLRRLMAGELAALVGEAALASDRHYRGYGYRAAARAHLQRLDPRERVLLSAYVEGVNAGLASLTRRPPEYLVVRSQPEPWRPEDSLLAILYFYDGLSVDYRSERHRHTLFEALPPELGDFLTPDATRFDAPLLLADAGDPTGGYRPLPIPGPEVVDLRGREPGPTPTIRIFGDRPLGSNAWAVTSGEGLPVLASDPHLPHGIPNVWYRAELHWDAGRVLGAGPPGLPGILVGMSDHLTWGPTAAMVDQTDLVLVEVDPADTLRYRTPEGWEPFRVREELLQVRGGSPESLTVLETRWGPVRYRDHEGRPLALRSPAWDEGGLSLAYLELSRSRTVEEGVQLLADMGGPALALVLADSRGGVGWTVSGVLPRRRGMDGRVPISWSTPGVGWDGVLGDEERPSFLLRGEAGVVFTGNQRFVSLPASRAFGHQWILPTRARRIRDLLQESPPLSPETHHLLQLDTRSLAHEPIREFLLEWIPSDEESPPLALVRLAAADWDGTAGAASVEFPILVSVREELRNAVLGPLLSPAAELDPRFVYDWLLADEPVLRILEERPAHLLAAPYEDWDTFLREVVEQAVAVLDDGPGEAGSLPWGQMNRARITHPFGELSTALGWLLNLPRDPLPGWAGTIRAQAPDYGQSLRFTGRPGEPERGTFQMPGGQSGHFLSPFYQAGHDAWVRGDPAPLQAGPPVHELRLRPGGGR
jgi:penicillin G amidase